MVVLTLSALNCGNCVKRKLYNFNPHLRHLYHLIIYNPTPDRRLTWHLMGNLKPGTCPATFRTCRSHAPVGQMFILAVCRQNRRLEDYWWRANDVAVFGALPNEIIIHWAVLFVICQCHGKTRILSGERRFHVLVGLKPFLIFKTKLLILLLIANPRTYSLEMVR